MNFTVIDVDTEIFSNFCILLLRGATGDGPPGVPAHVLAPVQRDPLSLPLEHVEAAQVHASDGARVWDGEPRRSWTHYAHVTGDSR